VPLDARYSGELHVTAYLCYRGGHAPDLTFVSLKLASKIITPLQILRFDKIDCGTCSFHLLHPVLHKHSQVGDLFNRFLKFCRICETLNQPSNSL
jgi:hypothetical protein